MNGNHLCYDLRIHYNYMHVHSIIIAYWLLLSDVYTWHMKLVWSFCVAVYIPVNPDTETPQRKRGRLEIPESSTVCATH